MLLIRVRILVPKVTGQKSSGSPQLKDKNWNMLTRILRNINLQNLKRASAFIDIMDRHVDQEAQDFLTYYR
jgi:hypothetical protein